MGGDRPLDSEAFLDRNAHRLFAEDMEPALEPSRDLGGMDGRRTRDENGVQVDLGYHFPVIIVQRFDAQLLSRPFQLLWNEGAGGRHLGVAHPVRQVFGMSFPEPSQPHHADAQFPARRSRCFLQRPTHRYRSLRAFSTSARVPEKGPTASIFRLVRAAASVSPPAAPWNPRGQIGSETGVAPSAPAHLRARREGSLVKGPLRPHTTPAHASAQVPCRRT